MILLLSPQICVVDGKRFSVDESVPQVKDPASLRPEPTHETLILAKD